MKKTIVQALMTVIAATMITVGAVSPAKAAGSAVTCSVSNVAVDWRLNVACSGKWYNSYIEADGKCPAQPINSIRMWETMALSAMLAGKSVQLYVETTAEGCTRFTSLQVDK